MSKNTSNKVTSKRSYRTIIWALVLVLAIVSGLVLYQKRDTLAMHWFQWVGTFPSEEKDQAPAPDAAKWRLLSTDLQRWRLHYATLYRSAGSAAEKNAVIADARELLEHSLPEMMRCWLGTPWDFNGTATEPGGGKIACGYFVTTVLKEADFEIERNTLAQQASQQIIRTFVPQDELRIRVGVPYKTFRFETMRGKPGIYLIGLDKHVGFVVVKDQEFRFIHSSGSQPWCVVDESSELALVLERSNYRVLGNITGNDDVIRRWLMGEKFPTQR